MLTTTTTTAAAAARLMARANSTTPGRTTASPRASSSSVIARGARRGASANAIRSTERIDIALGGRRAARYPARAPRAIDPAFVDAFGVRASDWEQIEGALFGASLAPYLVFLYFLQKEASAAPRGVVFGFKFLLAFVFGTIPFAIYAKVEYDEILANCDVIHGVAESLLTLTNVFIVLGFRQGLREAHGDAGQKMKTSMGDIGAALFCALVVSNAVFGGASEVMAANPDGVVAAWDSQWPRLEPANALSLPTWVIHVSSLVEWLIAMGLAWEYAEVVKRPAWKGLTWGMVPCHASGIAACTFHLFYNAPALNSVVAMQALLTVIGNSTCAIAAYRICKEGERLQCEVVAADEADKADKADDIQSARDETLEISMGSESMKGWEDLSATWASDSDAVLLLKLALVSTAVSAFVKWGSLVVDFPFEPNVALAFGIIFIPTLLNCAKWAELSKNESA
jgi:hypothetical protein|mmetsp:Transcript_4002/g.13215  ORF Transcript_4002/g.13215 Transcript_4002/m.13215 type:complete len:455 (+) Transcript_4002:2-1366(+)